MKKKVAIAVIAVLCIAACIIAYYLYRMWPMLSTTMGRVEQTQEHQSHRASGGSSDEEDVSAVYMTEEITPEGLMNAYQALGVELTGDNIGVKLSTGEPGSNYLDPDLIADLVHHVALSWSATRPTRGPAQRPRCTTRWPATTALRILRILSSWTRTGLPLSLWREAPG